MQKLLLAERETGKRCECEDCLRSPISLRFAEFVNSAESIDYVAQKLRSRVQFENLRMRMNDTRTRGLAQMRINLAVNYDTLVCEYSWQTELISQIQNYFAAIQRCKTLTVFEGQNTSQIRNHFSIKRVFLRPQSPFQYLVKIFHMFQNFHINFRIFQNFLIFKKISQILYKHWNTFQKCRESTLLF